MKIRCRVLVIPVAALGLIVASPDRAWADPASFTWCEYTNDPGELAAKGCWVDDGDDWWVCDIDQGDSRHAVGDFYLERGFGVTYWDRVGHEEDDATGTDGCDLGDDVNVANHQQFKIRICVQNGNGDLYACDERVGRE